MIASKHQSVAIIVFTAAIIILVNIVWWLSFSQTQQRFEYQLSRRLAATVRLGASNLTPDLISHLTVGDLAAYDSALEIIENIAAVDSLSEVFILSRNNKYLATTLLTEDSVYYLAALNREYIDSAFSISPDVLLFESVIPSIVTVAYQVGDVYLKSAFTPLADSLGLAAAVLGIEADIDYTDVLGDLKKNLYLSAGFSIGGGILFGFFFFFIQRRLSRAEKNILLSQSQANLGRMVAVVSHEIKNPLMIMRASAEQLNKETESPESHFIIEEIDRLNGIVTNYLDFARGKQMLKIQSIEIKSFLSEIANQFKPRLAQDNVRLDIEDIEDIAIMADRSALRQVIINLILNGAEAATIAVNNQPEVIVSQRKHNNKCIIDIKDNGKGVSEKDARHLFEPFYTTGISGSGLGLFHSKNLIEQMGGKLTFKSRTGQPTVFSISLTIADKDK